MDELIIRDIEFDGNLLKATQDKYGIIWTGVRWVCDGIGFNEDRIKYERKRLNNDFVLSKGVSNLQFPTNGGIQAVLCLNIDYLPIWLAKISITPAMKRDSPEVVEKLIKYQLRAKDVLADAFLPHRNALIMPVNTQVSTQDNLYSTEALISTLKQGNNYLECKIDKVYNDIGKLARLIIDWKNAALNRDVIQEDDTDSLSINDFGMLNISQNNPWKRSVYEKAGEICDSTSDFNTNADVLSWIYKYINRNYGIVWEQETKDYRNKYKDCKFPSTIDIVQDNAMIKSIFDSVLLDLHDKHCGKNNNIEEEDRLEKLISAEEKAMEERPLSDMPFDKYLGKSVSEIYNINSKEDDLLDEDLIDSSLDDDINIIDGKFPESDCVDNVKDIIDSEDCSENMSESHSESFSSYNNIGKILPDGVTANDILVSGSIPDRWTDRIILPLVQKNNDRSNHGMITYRRVYSVMKISNRSWKNFTTRYMRNHRKKPYKKDLIESFSSLRKKFSNAVDYLMQK